ncbi:MAG: YceI family protein [Actinomycetota bacterium]|nr:YceI family protein [Actinomycetota bacterium]
MQTPATTTPGKIAGTYTVDPIHSSVGFAVRYMGVSTFRSNFSDVQARLSAESGELQLEGAAKVDSIGITSPEQFRAHVLGEDFFDAGKYPEIAFKSTRVELNDDATATVEGELTIKGVTRPVTAQGTWQGDTAHAFGGERAALQLETTVDRTEFGLIWNAPLPAGGNALDTQVTLNLELNLIKDS